MAQSSLGKRKAAETSSAAAAITPISDEPPAKHQDIKQDATISGACEQCQIKIPAHFAPGQKRTGILLLHVNSRIDADSNEVSQLFCTMKCVAEYASRRTCQ